MCTWSLSCLACVSIAFFSKNIQPTIRGAQHFWFAQPMRLITVQPACDAVCSCDSTTHMSSGLREGASQPGCARRLFSQEEITLVYGKVACTCRFIGTSIEILSSPTCALFGRLRELCMQGCSRELTAFLFFFFLASSPHHICQRSA